MKVRIGRPPLIQKQPGSPPARHQYLLLLLIVPIAAFAYFPFVRGTRVPLIGWVDLAFHEAGHLLTMFWAPLTLSVAAGSFTQLLFPALFVIYFLHTDQLAGAAVSLAWLGSSFQDVSVYARDAPTQALPLLADGLIHDWNYLLGPRGLNMLSMSSAVADLLLLAAVLSFAAAVSVLLYHIFR